MLNNPLNLSVVANNDIPVFMTAKNPDKSPVDITGFSIKWQAFKADNTPFVTKSTGDGSISIVDGPAGIFTFKLLATDTKDIPPGSYVHEAVTVDGDGDAVTLANDDPKLTVGSLFLRRQYTAQG